MVRQWFFLNFGVSHRIIIIIITYVVPNALFLRIVISVTMTFHFSIVMRSVMSFATDVSRLCVLDVTSVFVVDTSISIISRSTIRINVPFTNRLKIVRIGIGTTCTPSMWVFRVWMQWARFFLLGTIRTVLIPFISWFILTTSITWSFSRAFIFFFPLALRGLS